jgi:hypothetical protein
MRVLAMVTLMVTLCFAGVGADTAHEPDAAFCYYLLSSVGYDDATVFIGSLPNRYTVDYFVGYDMPSGNNMERFIAAIVAVAQTSAVTDWTSGNLHVIFSDGAISMTTADVRWIASNYNAFTADDLMDWVAIHSVTTEFEEE